LNGDDQNTEFDAMQVTLAQSMYKGLNINANYQWASAFSESSGYYTWSHKEPVHGRDTNTRGQQLTAYGSYDLPFGKGKQLLPDANRITDLIIGGYQLSATFNWSGGLPFTLSTDCYTSVGGTSAPCVANVQGGGRLSTKLASFQPGSGGTGTRSFYTGQSKTSGIFATPAGLDKIGNVGRNTYWGPHFYTSDMAITKAFTIWESVVAKFRMDAFNVFNHINPGNPGGYVFSDGTIYGEAAGCVGSTCGPRQLEFSMRVQF
jgi:hypothetical protein